MNNAKKQRKVEWERLQRSLQEYWRYQKKFHVSMGMIKDRNSKDLTEGEEIKNRWQEYIEELYKRDLTWENTMVQSLT